MKLLDRWRGHSEAPCTLQDMQYILSVYTGLIAAITIWLGYKKFKERKQFSEEPRLSASYGISGEAIKEEDTVQIGGFEALTNGYSCLRNQKGYLKCRVGDTLQIMLILGLAASQLLLLLFVAFEMYIPVEIAHQNWDDRAIAFILAWFICFVAMLVLRSVSGGYSTYFYDRCKLSSCGFLLFHKPVDRSKLGWSDSSATHGLKPRFQIWKYLMNFLSDDTAHGRAVLASVNCSTNGVRYVEFQGKRWCYVEELNQFVDVEAEISTLFNEAKKNKFIGLTSAEAICKRDYTGSNEIEFESSSYTISLISEFLSVPFLLQLSIIWAELFWRNYLSTTIWGLLTIYSVVHKVVAKLRNETTLREMIASKDSLSFDTIRDGGIKKTLAKELVVGDILLLDDSSNVPCDLLVLNGGAAVDESNLTGESIPVRKYPFTGIEDNEEMDIQKCRGSILFAGTHVVSQFGDYNTLHKKLNTTIETKKKLVGLVIRTGGSTEKAAYLRTIVSSERITLQYGKQLPIVYLVLSIYAAICIAIQVALLGYCTSSFFYSLGTVSQVTPIWISAVLYIGQNVASRRLLKENQIYCLDTERIAMCGKIRVMCFDKTGTLTKTRMDFIGVLPIDTALTEAAAFITSPITYAVNGNTNESSGTSESEFVGINEEEVKKRFAREIPDLIHRGMLCCHSLNTNPEDGTYYGDELELSLFNAAGGILQGVNDPISGAYQLLKCRHTPTLELQVLKTFEFDHIQQSMSVIVKDRNNSESSSKVVVYCKGSCERLQELCSQGVPRDIKAIEKQYSQMGYYVLGLGYKEMTDEHYSAATKEDVECNLQFVSLLLFRNDVKSEAPSTIRALKVGKIRPVMVTGDNSETAYYVGKRCGLFDEEGDLGEHDTDTSGSDAEPLAPAIRKAKPAVLAGTAEDGAIVWRNVETGEVVKNYRVHFRREFSELIVSSKCFHLLRKMLEDKRSSQNLCDSDEEPLLRDHKDISNTLFDKLLMNIRIFSRMKPEDKVLVIQAFMKRGYITGMCGDGSNDSGALKEAHAGLSFSEGESSLISGFTSKSFHLRSVIDLLREGRGSLVTSLACYKFLILFGLLISLVKLLLFKYSYSIMPEMGYTLIDCLILLGLSQAMALSRPKRRLRVRSPTSSLLGATTILSLASVLVVDLLFLCILISQINAYGLRSSKEYNMEIPMYAWWMKSDNYEAPCICIWLCFQLVTAAFVFSLGGIFRRSVFRNVLLSLWCLGLWAMLTYLVISPPSVFTCLFRINCTDSISREVDIPFLRAIAISAKGMPFWGEYGHNVMSFEWKLWFLMITLLNSFTTICVEKYIIGGAPAKYFREKNKTSKSADFLRI